MNNKLRIIIGSLIFFVPGIIAIYIIWSSVDQKPDKINETLAIIAFYGLVIAFFQNPIQSWVMRPELRLIYHHAPPDCYFRIFTVKDIEITETFIREMAKRGTKIDELKEKNERNQMFLRMRIRNEGMGKAEIVEVQATKLEIKYDGKYEVVEKFIPVNFQWTHGTQTFLPSLTPGAEKLCEIGFIYNPDRLDKKRVLVNAKKGDLVFYFQVGEQTGLPNYIIGKGEYKLHLTIVASNSKPKKYELSINTLGEWSNESEKLLKEGVILSLSE